MYIIYTQNTKQYIQYIILYNYNNSNNYKYLIFYLTA